jgi:predicted nucleic acid-binding protein
MRVALLDTGPLVAFFDEAEPAHAHYTAVAFGERPPRRLHTTWPCIVEASHLLAGALRWRMLEWVARGGATVFPFDQAELAEMLVWMQRYSEPRKRQMDLADASLVWLAAQTGVTAVMTLDVRDFSRYRLPDGRSFELL